jgi:hypothetical protein
MRMLGLHYNLRQLFVEPADVGFSCVGRPRTYLVFSHKIRTVPLVDPVELYESIREKAGCLFV